MPTTIQIVTAALTKQRDDALAWAQGALAQDNQRDLMTACARLRDAQGSLDALAQATA